MDKKITQLDGITSSTVDDYLVIVNSDVTKKIKRSNLFNIEDGFFGLGTPTELTISGGVITITKGYHIVDTESDDATDDLDTINGGDIGKEVILSSANSDRDIVFKHGTGNLRMSQGNDFTLDNINATIKFIYNGSNWTEISRSANV